MFIECSAKTKLGIQQAFEELVQKVRAVLTTTRARTHWRPRYSRLQTCCNRTTPTQSPASSSTLSRRRTRAGATVELSCLFFFVYVHTQAHLRSLHVGWRVATVFHQPRWWRMMEHAEQDGGVPAQVARRAEMARLHKATWRTSSIHVLFKYKTRRQSRPHTARGSPLEPLGEVRARVGRDVTLVGALVKHLRRASVSS